jgi:4-amino-4-deoxy-L-arabinose transferase-like glycosyltransferase
VRGRIGTLARSRAGSWLGLGLLVLVFVALGARWIRVFREGGLLDIDEAGYQTMAVLNFRGWESGGVAGWWESFLAPGVQAPLMPGVTTPYYAVGGVGALVGLLVPLTFGALCLLASYGLGRRISPAVGWVTVLLVAGTPAVISFSRTFNFAIASAATVALTLWALARSRNFHSPAWSLLVGVFAGLAVLSRTLTLALMPGLAVAAVIAVAVGPHRGRRCLNVLVAAVGSAAVAGPWYWKNGDLVWDYLTSFGYGSRLAEYGSDESVLSATSWLHSIQYALGTLALPMAVLWAVGFLLVAFAALGRRADGPSASRVPVMARWGRSALMPSAAFVVWGALILTSTGNKGSGFLLPLVPAASLLVAAGIVAAPRPVRAVAGTLAALVLLVNTAAAADSTTALAERRTVDLPVLGRAEVIDGRGEIQSYIGGGFRPPSTATLPLDDASVRAWARAVRDVSARIDEIQPNVVMFGFRHRLLNVNSVQFSQLAAGGPVLPVGVISPIETPDQTAMSAWLAPDGPAASVCTLLLSPGDAMEFEPVVDMAALRRAAKEQGFRSTGEQWEMPGRRVIQVWQRC